MSAIIPKINDHIIFNHICQLFNLQGAFFILKKKVESNSFTRQYDIAIALILQIIALGYRFTFVTDRFYCGSILVHTTSSCTERTAPTGKRNDTITTKSYIVHLGFNKRCQTAPFRRSTSRQTAQDNRILANGCSCRAAGNDRDLSHRTLC